MLLKDIIEKYNLKFKINKDLLNRLNSIEIKNKPNYYRYSKSSIKIDNKNLKIIIHGIKEK